VSAGFQSPFEVPAPGGITSERVQEWAGAGDGNGALTGFAGSSGVAEGVARVILDVRDIGKLEDGEILS
jgi:pyruvate,water dikinase